jgi:hypothetical protein
MNPPEDHIPKFETTIIYREDLENPDMEELLMTDEENTILSYTLLITLSFLAFTILV